MSFELLCALAAGCEMRTEIVSREDGLITMRLETVKKVGVFVDRDGNPTVVEACV